MKDTIKILMHATPAHINRAELIESLMQIKVCIEKDRLAFNSSFIGRINGSRNEDLDFNK